MIYLDSCSLKSMFSEVPDVRVKLYIAGSEGGKMSKTITSTDPMFQEGFTFKIKNVEGVVQLSMYHMIGIMVSTELDVLGSSLCNRG
jgi:hypothetical protein